MTTPAATSKNGVPIRLPDERWEHITEEHAELVGMQSNVLGVVTDPEKIFAGSGGELLAMRTLETGKWLVVAYRELENDGFVITAFLTRRAKWFERREQLWP